jgi:hypothetical protein
LKNFFYLTRKTRIVRRDYQSKKIFEGSRYVGYVVQQEKAITNVEMEHYI